MRGDTLDAAQEKGVVAHPAELARDAVRALMLYGEPSRECAVDVSDNTNLWGSPPAALEALGATLREAPLVMSRYPATYSASLAARVLEYHGLAGSGKVGAVMGCGSDDVLDSAMRAFSTEGACIAYSTPTFSMIPVFARLNGLRLVEVPLTETFDIDPERLVAARAAITYVCAPNNPTATPVSRAALEEVIARAAGIVIVDEAYGEFSSTSVMDLVRSHPRLLVTRTFSKAFGMAGLRVGYGVGGMELVDLVARARGPYKVTAAAERAAAAALGDGADARGWVETHVREALRMRGHLEAGLAELGLRVLPSDANFVFVPLREAVRVAAHMLECGVRVRTVTRLAGPRQLQDEAGAGLRIGVGPRETMDAVLAALRNAPRDVAPSRANAFAGARPVES